MNCKNDECKVRMIKEGTHAKCPDNSSCGDYIPPTNASECCRFIAIPQKEDDDH